MARTPAKAAGEADRQGQQGNTFEAIAAEVVAARKKQSGKAQATLDKFDWFLDLAKPVLGKRPITEISAAKILVVLRKIEARGDLRPFSPLI